MSLKDITITGSIGSIATQSYGQRTYISSTDEQSFPIEHITGSDAKVWPNFVQGENYTVNLVVNVTQSWSGSNVTPLGIVPYVHNTMEEFIDGEFSGSNYVVTDGNLNDAQCEQFLTVSTAVLKYSMFYYTSVYQAYGTYYQTPVYLYLDTFLDEYTSPRIGEFLIHQVVDIYPVLSSPFYNSNTRVTYLKVSIYDKDGNDNTLSLNELNQFIWTDTVAGRIVLTIKNITRYSNYYLYEVESDIYPDLSPISFYFKDANRLNYAFSASSAIPSASTGLTYLDTWTVINNPTGDFNGYEYSFALTPNMIIYYTASITATNNNGSNVNFDFGFWGNKYVGNDTYFTPINVTSSITMSAGTTRTFTLTGSYQFIGTTTNRYHLETANLTAPISLSNTFWIMSQSTLPYTPSSTPQLATSSVIVLEPYVSSIFTNSDCDVLINNASQNDISTLYRRVLYDGDSGSLVPSNFQQIINGTAEYAQINDYLYNANANVLPRYEGCRVEQQFLNKWTNGDIGPSLTPSVQLLKTSIAYSTTVVDQAPIKMNASKIFVKYYIDEAGNTVTPNVDKTSIYVAQGNFPTGENLDINYAVQGTTSDPQYKPIIRGGARLEPIIYNQIRDYTNPPMQWSPSMSFTDNNPLSSTTINDFTATLRAGLVGTNYLTHNSPPSGIGMIQIVQKGSAITTEVSPNSSSYQITNNLLAERLDLRFEVSIDISNNNPWPVLVGGSIMKSSSLGLNRNYYLAPRITIGANSTYPYRFSTTEYFSSLQSGDRYSIGLFTDDGTTDPNYFQRVIYSQNGTFKISTNPLPTAPISTSGLFQIAPSIPYYIYTTSSQLLGFYGNNETRQVDITGSTFSPVTLPFTLQVGDEFRFDGDESKAFMVKGFDKAESGSGLLSLSSASLYIEFDRQISGSNVENINHFLLRRYVDDAESIIFTNTSDKRITGSLIISPEYKSTLLNNNINQYIENLTQKGLI